MLFRKLIFILTILLFFLFYLFKLNTLLKFIPIPKNSHISNALARSLNLILH